MDTIKLGNNVKELRQNECLTQYQLAIDSGVTPTTISRIENGKGASDNTLRKIAKIFGATINELKGE